MEGRQTTKSVNICNNGKKIGGTSGSGFTDYKSFTNSKSKFYTSSMIISTKLYQISILNVERINILVPIKSDIFSLKLCFITNLHS